MMGSKTSAIPLFVGYGSLCSPRSHNWQSFLQQMCYLSQILKLYGITPRNGGVDLLQTSEALSYNLNTKSLEQWNWIQIINQFLSQLYKGQGWIIIWGRVLEPSPFDSLIFIRKY